MWKTPHKLALERPWEDLGICQGCSQIGLTRSSRQWPSSLPGQGRKEFSTMVDIPPWPSSWEDLKVCQGCSWPRSFLRTSWGCCIFFWFFGTQLKSLVLEKGHWNATISFSLSKRIFFGVLYGQSFEQISNCSAWCDDTCRFWQIRIWRQRWERTKMFYNVNFVWSIYVCSSTWIIPKSKTWFSISGLKMWIFC